MLKKILVVMLLFVAVPAWAANTLERTVLRVENISCISCLTGIKDNLARIEGIGRVGGDIPNKLVVVEHRSDIAAETVARSVSDLGYPATVVTDPLITRQLQPTAGKSCCGSKQNAASPSTWQQNRESITSVYRVANLSCTSCLNTIGEALQDVKGALGVNANFACGLVMVGHLPGVDTGNLAERMTAAGYPATYLGHGNISSLQDAPAPGCGSRSCSATSSSWSELYKKLTSNRQ